jgi:hypothetical protein
MPASVRGTGRSFRAPVFFFADADAVFVEADVVLFFFGTVVGAGGS